MRTIEQKHIDDILEKINKELKPMGIECDAGPFGDECFFSAEHGDEILTCSGRIDKVKCLIDSICGDMFLYKGIEEPMVMIKYRIKMFNINKNKPPVVIKGSNIFDNKKKGKRKR